MDSRGILAKNLIFIFLLSLHTCCSSSGTLVGLSYDARGASPTWSPGETFSLLRKNNISVSHFRVLLANPPQAFPDPPPDSDIRIDLSVEEGFQTHLPESVRRLNIDTIVLTRKEGDATRSLLPDLNSVRSALEALAVERRPKVSATFALPTLEKDLPSIAEFVERTKSSIFVEAFVDGDKLVQSVVERALHACSLLPNARVVLYVKTSVVPSVTEIAEFSDGVTKSIEKYPQIRERISKIYVDVSPLVESLEKEVHQEKEMIFPSSRRELVGEKTTFRFMKVSRDIVTVPSTDPPTVFPTTTSPPITIPSTNPTTAPITIPALNPTPTTMPTTAPVTVPPVVPVANPVNQPVTNPVTGIPLPPPSPVMPVGGTTPTGTVPAGGTPTAGSSGQSWCVAKSGAPESVLQSALDYACGSGKADCASIQMSGACYSPNSLQAHASYAFNSYYQKNPVPTSCNFGGAATIATTNPSTGTCNFPSSSSASNVNPASSTGGGGFAPTGPTPTYGSNSGSGMPLVNPDSPGGSTAVMGSESPTGAVTSSALCLYAGWPLLLLALTTSCFAGSV
ncbi:glucan endo-1,3-beta-glucosidase 12-like isoform X2 [Iris pallida]|uniref:Glucan endo-1,3-beta-glucosidase 12-like isoform X2 n=1 Tax=Iris pallida TaxID=29817 RepID=A0AAX6FKG9_IRIPA|nr:glucan endo-1,3-beta-glucosidase 12-like isoform X2 [Iris pallida]